MILRKNIKFVATRCQILRLKCTKFNFSCGSALDPAGGAYSAPPDPLAGFRGHTSKEKGEEEGKGEERGTGMGLGAREGEGMDNTPRVELAMGLRQYPTLLNTQSKSINNKMRS